MSISLEFRRNLFHLTMGILIAFSILYVPREVAIIGFGTGLLLCVAISERLKVSNLPIFDLFVDKMEREGKRPGSGVITFFIGSLIAVSVFSTYIAFVSILLVAIIDSFTVIIGKRFGKIKIYKDKSLRGFLAGFLMGLMISVVLLPVHHAIIVCLAASLTELYIPHDNISIPVVSGTVLTLIGFLA